MRVFSQSLAIAQAVDSERTEPEAVLSIIKEIINNEEFVLQSVSRQRGTATSLRFVPANTVPAHTRYKKN